MSLYLTLTFLFGTEFILNLRRQLVLLREKIMRYEDNDLHSICSGSLGEGIAYPPSDDDVMLFRTGRRVVRKFQEGTQNGDVVMTLIEESPGYCLLLDIKRSYPSYIRCYSDGIPFVSSSLWKLYINPAGEGSYIHGPCHTYAVGDSEFDYAIVIPCSFWPDVACEWICRKRYDGWPSHETIQDIVKNRCHVVAVGDPDSPLRLHAWRISFSVGERKLMHSLNHVQFLTYNFLRITLKQIMDRRFPGILCSYFMKTTLFYTVEKTSAQLWKAHNVEACFKICLSTLYEFIDKMYCPNFFIQEYKMMKRKVNLTNRRELLETIRNLHSTDAVSILQMCGEQPDIYIEERLGPQMMEGRIDREIFESIHICKVRSKIMRNIYLQNEEYEHQGVCLMQKFLHFLISKETFSNNICSGIFLQDFVACCCLKLTDISLSLFHGNKQMYSLHKTTASLLRFGYRGDMTTGKLTTATYLILIGKTRLALSIVQQLRLQYPGYALDVIPDANKSATYLEVMCGKGYSTGYKSRYAWAPTYCMLTYQVLSVVPTPLKILVALGKFFFLPSIIYALVLECLCYIRLNESQSLKKETRHLMKYVNNIKAPLGIAYSVICIGVIHSLQGDRQSACRWLGSALMIADKVGPPYNQRLSLAALTYIALLLKLN